MGTRVRAWGERRIGNFGSVTDLTPLQVLGIFGGIPVALFLLISLLVVAPSWARDARYRPGLPWNAEPVWFGGPSSAATGEVDEAAEPVTRPSRGEGGGSASW